MPYSGAVLVIGSLYWDGDGRAKWQKERIRKNDSISIYAPIRYGRKSEGRGDTYTMVFSQLTYRKEYGLGTALLLPLTHLNYNFEDLKFEATELWKAERKKTIDLGNEISREWGAVGLSINPAKKIDKKMLDGWTKLFTSQQIHPVFAQTKTEKPSIDLNGFLNIRWPIKVSDNAPAIFDFILATATQATLENNRYPTARMIANAWQKDNDGHIEYFWNNRKNGISTFQDAAIERYLGGL